MIVLQGKGQLQTYWLLGKENGNLHKGLELTDVTNAPE